MTMEVDGNALVGRGRTASAWGTDDGKILVRLGGHVFDSTSEEAKPTDPPRMPLKSAPTVVIPLSRDARAKQDQSRKANKARKRERELAQQKQALEARTLRMRRIAEIQRLLVTSTTTDRERDELRIELDKLGS